MDSFNCPVTVTTHIIGGKWKPSILFYLQGRIRRFSELQKLLSGPTKKMLTQQLRELERDDIICLVDEAHRTQKGVRKR